MQAVEKRIVHPVPPFSLQPMQTRLGLAKATEYRIIDADTVMVVTGNARKPHILRVHDVAHNLQQPELEVICYAETAAQAPEAFARLELALSLALDLQLFYNQVADDPVMHGITQRFVGLRPVREPNLFAGIVKTIIGQQLNMAFAGKIIRRLVDTYGAPVTTDGMDWMLFPTPDVLARINAADLQQLQFSQRKAEYVIGFAQAVDSGQLDLDALAKLPDDEVTAMLTSLRGLGRWSAESTLMMSLGRLDVFPAGDVGLRHALQHAYNMTDRPTDELSREFAQRWRPYRTLAAFYLWETKRDF